MNITFLIGNGFDLNLGLATAYSDFVKYYKETDAEKNVLIKFRQDISDNEAHWSAAEIEMGRYTGTFKTGQGEAFSECHTDFCKHLAAYLKQQQDRIDYDYIAKQIEQAFANINALAKPYPERERSVIEGIYSRYASERTTFNFINFNYTDTLDKCIALIKSNQSVLGSHRSGSTIYNHRIGEVQHVHGTLESQMVFGVNDESQIAKPDIFECDYGDIYEASFIKKQANENYRENTDSKVYNILKGSQLIYIYGMSIGETDSLWWEKICEWLAADPYHHLIMYKHSLPHLGLLGKDYLIGKRKARNEIMDYSAYTKDQLKSIGPRIHVTGENLFGELNVVADKTKSPVEIFLDAADKAASSLNNGSTEFLEAYQTATK